MGEGDGQGSRARPRDVLVELADAAVVEAQTFPHRVAALHRGVEWAHARLVAVKQFPVHVDDQVAIAFVEGL